MRKQYPPSHDPSHDVLFYQRQPLDAILKPQNIALIGATEKANAVGRTILWNLIHNPFGGIVFPVNPKRASVMGIKAYPNVTTLPEPVDLAIIATPAQTVPDIVQECIQAGVKGAIVISAGFKECGPEGIELERQILVELRQSKMRLIGPNCLGIMNPVTGLNATFARAMARPGNVGFISQSGALCTAILDWSLQELFGFSAFISIGSMLDVNWGDLINYLGDDPNTKSIVIYMESIGDARSFLSAAREVALTKPIIVIKAGHTEAAAKAASSHTGSLTGSDAVLDAAFRRCGVLRVNRISDLFYMTEVLAKQPRPRGPRLTILTNAGGAGVLATDALIASGGKLAELSEETLESLNKILPLHWSHANPIDILGDASPERYVKTLEIASIDPNTDGFLLILAPQAMTDPTRTAELLSTHAKIEGKPILSSWMGGLDIATAKHILNMANIPNFPYPDEAVQAFNYMWKYDYNLGSLYETPTLPADTDEGAPNRARVEKIIQNAHEAGRTLLTEYESKEFLSAYGIPTVKTCIAASESEAVKFANEIGYPVVLKLHSQTVTHKTDVGGVALNLTNDDRVRQAYQAIESSVKEKAGSDHFLGVSVQPMIQLEGYEIILGSSIDSQVGPTILFGSGGQLVEISEDRALALPPLNTTLARRLIEQTHVFTALKGTRGRKGIDLSALELLLVRFSQLVTEQHWIKEIDINPLLISPQQLIALDARILLYPKDVKEEQIPKLAIRPYPTQYVQPWKMKDGSMINIRPIRPEDEPLMVKFHETLSEHSVYMRFFQALKLNQRVAHERLIRRCFIDYDREMALVADYRNPETGTHEILGVGRLSKLRNPHEAEFAILVGDRYQNQGLGTELLRQLIQIGRDEKIHRITADILPENHSMQRVSEKLGFQIHRTMGDPSVKAEIILYDLDHKNTPSSMLKRY